MGVQVVEQAPMNPRNQTPPAPPPLTALLFGLLVALVAIMFPPPVGCPSSARGTPHIEDRNR